MFYYNSVFSAYYYSWNCNLSIWIELIKYLIEFKPEPDLNNSISAKPTEETSSIKITSFAPLISAYLILVIGKQLPYLTTIIGVVDVVLLSSSPVFIGFSSLQASIGSARCRVPKVVYPYGTKPIFDSLPY